MSLPLVIGIAGLKRSGKDALGQHFVRQHGYERRAFADKLREAALVLDPVVRSWQFEGEEYVERLHEVVGSLGWERAKDEVPEVRRTLDRLGTDVCRDLFGDNVWVDAVLPAQARTVITDVRFPNEVDAVLASRGVVVRVVRPGITSSGTRPETALDHLELPEVINDTTLDRLWLHGENVVRRETEARRPRVTIGCPICGSYDHTANGHPGA